ncbi:MAG: hypothetical protein AAB341_04915 [Planctomycetota bacterium]
MNRVWEERKHVNAGRVGCRCACSLRLAAAAAAVVLLADSAMAQTPGRVAGEDAGYLQWIVFGGIAVVVCATGFLNSKRSHLN